MLFMRLALILSFINTMTYYDDRLTAGLVALSRRRRATICHVEARSSSVLPPRNGVSWKRERANIRHRIVMSSAPRSCSSRPPASATTRSARAWTRHDRSSVSGAIASSKTASRASTRSRAAGVQPAFPPNVIVEVKRIACERPMDVGVPLARWSLPDLHREVLARGVVATISGTTLWRWLDADAIRPWRHRSWVFPRDPQFAERAGPVLDLYARHWDGRPLGPHDYVIVRRREDEHSSPAPLPSRRRPSPPGARCGSSTNTSGAAPGPIWPRGTCITRASLAAARPGTASPPLIAWSSRS